MPGFDHSILTDVGWDALADALSGKKLAFVHMEAGDGDITGGDAQMEGMTDLIHKVMDFPITSSSDDGKGQITLIGTISSKNNLTGAGFYFKELGVKATIDGGAELLYTVASNTTPDYVPDSGSASTVTASLRVVVKIDKSITPIVNITQGDVTAQNIGAGTVGPGWYRDKIGSILNFKRLVSPSNTLTLKDNPDTVAIDVNMQTAIPSGVIWEYGGVTPPSGWLFCDGTLRNTADYPNLFGAIGYRFGGSGAQFATPDCRGRVSMGAGNGPGLTARTLGELGGYESINLTAGQMPVHSHSASGSQPAHTHPIVDPTHAHGVYDPGHAHSVADGGHAHGVSDPQHVHPLNSTQVGVAFSGGSDQTVRVWPYPTDYTYFAATSIGIYGSGTGVGIYGAGTSIAIYGAGTGIYTNWAGGEAVTVSVANAGGSQPHSNVQPFLVVNKIIKI